MSAERDLQLWHENPDFDPVLALGGSIPRKDERGFLKVGFAR